MNTISEELLLQNMSDLEKLKANIYINSIQGFIALLHEKWEPKTKVEHWGDKQLTYYWDEYHFNWTIKDIAFKGYVFKNISSLMQKNDIMENHNKKFKDIHILSSSKKEIKNA